MTPLYLRSKALLTLPSACAGEAEPILREAVERATRSTSMVPRHPFSRMMASNLAQCYFLQGKTSEAAEVRKQFELPGSTSTTRATARTPAPRLDDEVSRFVDGTAALLDAADPAKATAPASRPTR